MRIVSLFVERLWPIRAWRVLMTTIDEIKTELERASAAQAELILDVQNVSALVGGLSGQVTDLQTQIADLQAQIAAGAAVTPEQLDALKAQATAVADGLVQIDVALDAVAPDPAPEEPVVE